MMLFDIFHLYRAEGTKAYMQSYVGDIDTLVLNGL